MHMIHNQLSGWKAPAGYAAQDTHSPVVAAAVAAQPKKLAAPLHIFHLAKPVD
jgi:hypothetical protein